MAETSNWTMTSTVTYIEQASYAGPPLEGSEAYKNIPWRSRAEVAGIGVGKSISLGLTANLGSTIWELIG
jgi:hypothetical protein